MECWNWKKLKDGYQKWHFLKFERLITKVRKDQEL
jgi:hypothetical protein